MSNQKKFYITTPIYYGTAAPHLGSLYSTLLADVFARWYKIAGYDTFFLTGTDEHGQKVAQAAQKAGKQPKEFVDQFIPAYKKIWADYHIDYTKFIRTTDAEHKKAVEHWVKQAQKNGDIYKASYEGWYCTPCETFVAEKSAIDTMPSCPQCTRDTNVVAEESYFFKLSNYQDKLLAFYKNNPDFIVPRERAHEVIRFVQDGLRDLSISRTSVTWGIPFPGDEKHVIYVWADALTNYISAIGYGDESKKQEFNHWWPADIQVMGKDIVRFHAIYWPAFLMAAGIKPPHQLLVHGWIKVGQQKMSKSLGNVIDPVELQQKYGADVVRYYLTRYMAITHDGQFDIQDLEQKISSDLANDLGNLLNRMLTLALKNGLEKVNVPTTWSVDSKALLEAGDAVARDVQKHMDERMVHTALARVWEFIGQVNSFFHYHEPWKLIKTDKATFEEIIAATCASLHTIALILWPVMPEKMEELLASLGVTGSVRGRSFDSLCSLRMTEENKSSHPERGCKAESKDGCFKKEFILTQTKPLFEKFQMHKEDEIKQEKLEKPLNSLILSEQSESKGPEIMIDDFTKIELRVGMIESCEPVEKSDKLYKLQVDFGEFGKRQILSGIKQMFAMDELIGKQAVFVFNLSARKMMGFESHGMLLVAKDADGKSAFVLPQKPVKNGSRLT